MNVGVVIQANDAVQADQQSEDCLGLAHKGGGKETWSLRQARSKRMNAPHFGLQISALIS
jgi:hypothetical protein